MKVFFTRIITSKIYPVFFPSFVSITKLTKKSFYSILNIQSSRWFRSKKGNQVDLGL